MTRDSIFVWLGLTLLMHTGGYLAAEDWAPPFPAPSADVSCALDFKPPQIPDNTDKALKDDWDDLDVCGKKGAAWKKLGCGDVCRVKLNNLRPTQASMGTAAVNCKARKMEQKINDENDYERYFKKSSRLVPVIIGPNEKLYLLDHHHMSYALHRADLNVDEKGKNREVLAVVLFNVTQDYLEKNNLQAIDQTRFETDLDGTAERVDGQALLCT